MACHGLFIKGLLNNPLFSSKMGHKYLILTTPVVSHDLLIKPRKRVHTYFMSIHSWAYKMVKSTGCSSLVAHNKRVIDTKKCSITNNLLPIFL